MKPIIHIEIGHVPFFKVLLFYILGMVLGYGLIWSPTLFLVSGCLAVFFFLLSLVTFFFGKTNKFFNGLFYVFLLLFGMWKYGLFVPQSQADFVGDEPWSQLVGVVSDEPIVKERSIRFPLRLEAGLDSTGLSIPVSGTIMVTVGRDSIKTSAPKYGERIQFENGLRAVASSYNPHEFDYRKYLQHKGIYHQVYLNREDYAVLGHELNWLSPVLKARQYFVDKFRLYIRDDLSFQIASALVFGYRSEMEQETLSAFTNTGTIHVLSVSGMHVSMVFLLLTFLMSPLDRIRYGRSIRFGSVLLVIWLYVVLTGMAPPILRAGIMITFIILASWMGRHQVSLNTLLASAFFILIFSPQMLFDVGFQLSYLAMLGIFLIYPLLRDLYVPRNKLLRPIVEYSYISVAAQLLTAPLALYYFGQFPNYFLLANLVIALPATVVMYVGIALMFFSFGGLGKVLGMIEQFSVQVMFEALKHIDRLPYATFQGIAFQAWQVVLLFLLIMALFRAFNFRSKKGIYATMALTVVLVSSFYIDSYRSYHYQGMKIYNIRQHIAIAEVDRGKATVYSTLDSLSHSAINYSVMPDLKRYCKPEYISFVQLPDSVNFQLNLLHCSITVWNTGRMPEDGESDLLLVRKNRWLREPYPDAGSFYILDGSNSWRSTERNQTMMDSLSIDYYVLKDNFAYVWENK